MMTLPKTIFGIKVANLADFWLWKTPISLIAVVMLPVKEPMYMLFTLVAIDFITGFAIGVMHHTVSSERICKGVKKILLYSLTVFAVRLVEIQIGFDSMAISKFVILYLSFTELISIMENLILIGVPLPASFIDIIGKQVKIKAIEDLILRSKVVSNELRDIEDIIQYHIPKVHSKSLRRLLLAKMTAWAMAVKTVGKARISTNGKKSGELFWLKIKMVFDEAVEEMEKNWEKAKISHQIVDGFTEWHKDRVDDFYRQAREKALCVGDCEGISQPDKCRACLYKKKAEIAQSLVLILYQTVTDVLKMEKNGLRFQDLVEIRKNPPAKTRILSTRQKSHSTRQN